ncbi:DNA excision repair protein ERCC-6 [Fasciola gigantica]|uniref:DNA excision repair protein ERCC-6 n=1 Tax=Fasciola gigantica TaxID=46835 RepID=A0A504Z494_FASGI|nr:DNA excision repair protein ERCC-6 [Fasciola gigantica]
MAMVENNAHKEISYKVEKALESVDRQTPDEPLRAKTSEVSKEVDPELMVEEARQLYHDGKLRQCVLLLHEVQRIAPSEKIQRKIARIETFLDQNNAESHVPTTNSSQKELVEISDGFSLPRTLYEKLYPYQQDGVRWLWKLHNTAPGGVLADDMGLGKTVQVISFLCGLFLSKRSSFTALVVMPVSVLVTWEAELRRWAPALHVCVFHDLNRQTRLRQLASIQRQGGILLTTYGMVTSNVNDLTADLNANPHYMSAAGRTTVGERQGPEFQWTYLVLDEAHKIKNPAAKTTKAIISISAKHRILLTGTAVQNNLRELWSLYNCTHAGRLLGRMQTFQMEYEKPITRAREKDATRAERAHGSLMAQSLRKLIDPYFLRRTKTDVLSTVDKSSDQLETSISQLAGLQLNERMPKKTELVVWLYLRKIQERSYRDFLQLDQVKELLLQSTRRSPLIELVILKKLCDHPRLLSRDQCLSLNLEVNQSPGVQFSKFHLPSATQLMEESGKLYFLSTLMNSFLSDAEQNAPYPPRTLIFSQSLRLLDMTEKVILALNKRPENVEKSRFHRVLRLDGSLSKVEERMRVIQQFERDRSYTVMLLTTQVGGVGLTLTAANRVVILDPSWNPATDAQAVDRAYRIGQKCNVLVYRLITCATVEEKIYRRQIFKDSVIRQTTSSGHNKTDHDPYRYFTHQDLRELFTLSDTRVSTTQEQLSQLHEAMDKWEDPWLKPHLNYLTGDEMRDSVFGLSFHDLMFTCTEVHEPVHPTAADEVMREQELLRNRMAAAEHAIARECADVNAPCSLRTDTTNSSGVPAYRPSDGLFLLPSVVDSRRPMLNRPHLGVPADHPNVKQATISWVTQPSAQSTQPDGTVDFADQLTTSLREMSISEAATPPRLLNKSPTGCEESSSCVIVSDQEDSLSGGLTGVQCEWGVSDTEQKWRSERSVTASLQDLAAAEYPLRISSSVQSAQLSTGRTASDRSLPTVDSPLPSSKTFLGSVHRNLCRSTPMSLKTAPLPMTPGTPSTSKKKPTEFTSTSSSPVTDGAKNLRRSTSASNRNTSVAKSIDDPSGSPLGSPENSSDGLLMDITADVDDEQLHQTVNMKSMHEILAKSGLLTPTEDKSEVDSPGVLSGHHEEIAVEDSCISTSLSHVSPMQQTVVTDSFDEVEIIGDSLVD